ncbi:MAG: ribokinase [Clostridiales bacterium]|nr:ribokinase [Clostridiales bacterium]
MKNKLCVFGSFFEDLCGRGPYLPKPGETLIGSDFTYGPGGKGSNQAVAAKRAMADVTMITKIGNDPYGELVLKFYEQEGINKEYIFIDKDNPTGIALILVDENTAENVILVVPGACHNITTENVESVKEVISQSSFLITQLEINIDATYQAIDVAYKNNVSVILNPAPAQKLLEEVYKKIDYITPNETEAEILTGIKTDSMENIKKAADWLFNRGVKNVIITLGKTGVFIKTANIEQLVPSFTVKAIDTTGAGDSFNGCLAVALLEGKDILEATLFAQAGAALSVTRTGAAQSMAYREEIEKFLKQL